MSKTVSSGEKNCIYFFGEKDEYHKIKPLRIILSKTGAYVQCYDRETKWMYLLIENHEWGYSFSR